MQGFLLSSVLVPKVKGDYIMYTFGLSLFTPTDCLQILNGADLFVLTEVTLFNKQPLASSKTATTGVSKIPCRKLREFV